MVAAYFAARHARDQEQIADNLALALFPLWQIMRFGELDASTTLWLPSVLPAVETAFLQSQRLSAVFNANVRFAELPVDVPLLFEVPDVQVPQGVSTESFRMPDLEYAPVADAAPRAVVEPLNAPLDAQSQRVAEQIARGRDLGTPQFVLDQIQRLDDVRTGRIKQVQIPLQRFDRQDVATTMTIQANALTKRAMPGPERELMQNALVRSSGAAIRESLNGGRGVTDRVVQLDKKIVGFARVTDGNPCALCALLASRGAVYGRGSFISSNKRFKPHPDAPTDVPDGWTDVAKVHDNCRCTLRPVFSRSNAVDAGAKHYKDLWDKVKITDLDLQKAKRANPRYNSRKLRHSAQMTKYRKLVKDNPFDGSQFDLNTMRRDLQERVDAFRDSGFPQDSPQVKWADQTISRIA
jgi:hypothetical protein